MIGHTFLTLLLPLSIALFYFSTPQSRRRPIFVLNVIVIILAFASGTMIDAFAIHSMLSPLKPWPTSVNIAIGILGAVQSILVDIVLLVRLISVHPLSYLGLTRFTLLIALPILLKIARVINLIIFIKVLANTANLAVVWASAPYLKIEWFAQVIDNAYASLAFLWTIRDRGIAQGTTSNVLPTRVTFAQRMRTLSRIALSNFIIPSVFSIIQLVVVYRDVDVFAVNDIVLVNTMLAVFGVVFATVWAGTVGKQQAQVDSWGETSGTAVDAMEKKRPRRYEFPGLGTWRVATSPPTTTLGSTEHTSPAVDKGETMPESRRMKGVPT